MGGVPMLLLTVVAVAGALRGATAAEGQDACSAATRRYLGAEGGPIVPGLHVVCVSAGDASSGGAYAEVFLDSSSSGSAQRVDVDADADDAAADLRRKICALGRHPKTQLAEAAVDDLALAAYDDPRVSDDRVDALLLSREKSSLQEGLRELFNEDVQAGNSNLKLSRPVGAAVVSGRAADKEGVAAAAAAAACESGLALFSTTGRRILTNEDLSLSAGEPDTQQQDTQEPEQPDEDQAQEEQEHKTEDLSSLKLRELYTRATADSSIDEHAIDDAMENDEGAKELLIQLLQEAQAAAAVAAAASGGGEKAEQKKKPEQPVQVIFAFTGGKWQWPPVRIGHEWHLPATKRHAALVLETVSVRPAAFLVRDFLTEVEADHVRSKAAPAMRRSAVGGNLDTADGWKKMGDDRSSRNTFLPHGVDRVVRDLESRANWLTRTGRNGFWVIVCTEMSLLPR
eukprot:COSAG06_NODE_477_length_15216_cov_133.572402_5_plen_456_part_00